MNDHIRGTKNRPLEVNQYLMSVEIEIQVQGIQRSANIKQFGNIFANFFDYFWESISLSDDSADRGTQEEHGWIQ